MKFEGTLASVCEYLEITQVFNERVRELLPRIVVTGIESDTRRVTKGSIFYAKKGAHFDPFEHIDEIKEKGAVAILIDAPEQEMSGFPLETIDADKAAAGDALKLGASDKNAQSKDTISRLKRSGYCVVSEYRRNDLEAIRHYHATDNSQEARLITEAKMLRLVIPRNKSLSGLAGFIYGNPSEQLRLIGVTGTNGKSTITNLIAQMLNKCGHKCAVFGTLGYGFLDELHQSANTTMDAITLQQQLAEYVKQGADYAVLEVSSIGFCEGRVAGLKFYAGAFSNLSRDHLDYHENMEDYFCSKLNFLRTVPVARLVLNCKNDVGRRFAETLSGAYQVNLGLDEVPKNLTHMLNIKRVNFKPSSLEIVINIGEKKTARTSLKLLGAFNAENYAVALGVLLSMGYDIKHLLRISSELKPITGRMECFTAPDKPRLIVDYAHTHDGIEQALKATQSHNQSDGRIFSIVGCGGDRDCGKRPLMAMKASVYSDYAIFTADNPRSESLEFILDDMMMAIDANPAQTARRKAHALYDKVKIFTRDLLETGTSTKSSSAKSSKAASSTASQAAIKTSRLSSSKVSSIKIITSASNKDAKEDSKAVAVKDSAQSTATPAKLLSDIQIERVKKALDAELVNKLKESFKSIDERDAQLWAAKTDFKKADVAVDELDTDSYFADERLYSDAIEVFETVLAKLEAVFSFEEYDDIRMRADQGIVNVEERGAYYKQHQVAFSLPPELPSASRADSNVIIISDRYQAIRFAFEHASKNDCVLIAGKGHEDYQIFPDKTIHFSDREICRELLGLDASAKKLAAVKTATKSAAKPATKATTTKATASKAAATKTATKSTTAKASATKATASKAAAKPATKATASKSAATKTAAKPAAKATASKAAASKTAAKPATKATASKAAAKPATKATATKTAAKPAAKATASKAAATKTAAKPATKATASKAAAKPATKATASKAAAKPAAKATASKAAAKPAAKACGTNRACGAKKACGAKSTAAKKTSVKSRA